MYSYPNEKQSVRHHFLAPAIALLLVCTVFVTGLLTGCGSSESDDGATASETAVPTDEEGDGTSASETAVPTVHGEPIRADLLQGEWVTYYNGLRIEYIYDGAGNAVFTDASGNSAEYQYTTQGDRLIQTSGEKKQVYLWSDAAVHLLSDHTSVESTRMVSDLYDEIEDFNGFIYVDGDILYIGRLVMCREEAMTQGDDSLVGSWIGTQGDCVTFTEDGEYHYREEGVDYDGKYDLLEDGAHLKLILGKYSTTYTEEDWGVKGRTLYLNQRYYFRENGK